MLNCCVDRLTPLPDINIYINCDTILAINLSAFNINEYDEFVFTIKNFDYIDSSYVFIYKATLQDINDDGEIIFAIGPDTSKNIKPGAFYNFELLVNSFNPGSSTLCKKLTENGKVNIKYGAQDLALMEADSDELDPESITITGIRLKAIEEDNNNV